MRRSGDAAFRNSGRFAYSVRVDDPCVSIGLPDDRVDPVEVRREFEEWMARRIPPEP